MSFFDSKVSKLYVAQYDLTAALTNVQVNPSAKLLDKTVLGDDGMKHQRGIEDGSIAIEGYYEDTAAFGLDVALDALKADTDGEVATYWPAGDTREYLGYSAGAALLEGYEYTSRVGSLVTARANLVGNGTFDRPKSLNAKKTVTASTNETSIDDAASSSAGGIFIVHIVAFSATGGNAQWKLHLQESSDDGSGDAFAAISSITITAVGATRVTFSGAFERYVRLRAERDATSGSLTYQTSYVRS